MDHTPRPLIEEITGDLFPLVEQRRDGALLTVILDLHPADIAEILVQLGDEDDQRYLFGLIKNLELASAVLSEVPSQVREHLIEGIPSPALADLVEGMSSDDAADLVQELDEKRAARVLREVEADDLEALSPLLEYDEETAGGIMATEVLSIGSGATIADALDLVRTRGEEYEPFFFVYVVDDRHRLQGTLSLRNLVLHDPATPVLEACNREPVVVHASMDQEEVANLFRRYDLLAAPVVDAEGLILGRITIDDVVDVMREEAEEDIARIAGTGDEQFDEVSVRRIALIRLPWILASVGGGLLAGLLLNWFTSSLTVGYALIAFAPVIMAMGGNAGSQAAITMVRLLALRSLSRRDVMTILLRESRVGLVMGSTIGVLMGLLAFFWRGALYYGVVVGVSMAAAILAAAAMGTIAPLLFKRMRVDPAIATGPFVTLSNDASGLLIYFGLAYFLLRMLGGTL
jgi:magnesium transporter